MSVDADTRAPYLDGVAERGAPFGAFGEVGAGPVSGDDQGQVLACEHHVVRSGGGTVPGEDVDVPAGVAHERSAAGQEGSVGVAMQGEAAARVGELEATVEGGEQVAAVALRDIHAAARDRHGWLLAPWVERDARALSIDPCDAGYEAWVFGGVAAERAHEQRRVGSCAGLSRVPHALARECRVGQRLNARWAIDGTHAQQRPSARAACTAQCPACGAGCGGAWRR